MTRLMSRAFVSLVCAVACTLFLPAMAAACACTGADPCTGAFCYCACSICQDTAAPQNPCRETLAFNASEAELQAFQEQIEIWSTQEDLRPMADAATDLYNSVLFQDHEAFAEANSKFQKALSDLPLNARLSLIVSSEPARPSRK